MNRIYVDDRKVIICIDLTDEANTPPLEQVRFWDAKNGIDKFTELLYNVHSAVPAHPE